MAIFEDNVSHEDRVSILIYYALMGDDKVLYDEDAGFLNGLKILEYFTM